MLRPRDLPMTRRLRGLRLGGAPSHAAVVAVKRTGTAGPARGVFSRHHFPVGNEFS